MRRLTMGLTATAGALMLVLTTALPAMANPEVGYENCTPSSQQGLVGVRGTTITNNAWSNQSNGLNAYRFAQYAANTAGYLESGQGAAYWRRVVTNGGSFTLRYDGCTSW